jgi:multiple sugar transport system substrate-binding protein
MHSEQREALDDLITKIQVGRTTRRSFLERALFLGLSSSTALSLLDACNQQPHAISKQTTVVWESEHEYEDIYYQLTDRFNKSNTNGIFVVHISGPGDTGQLRNIFVNMLENHKSNIDVMSMDIIWPAEFAQNKWTYPVDDKWPISEQNKYLPGPIKACRFYNRVWAVPHHIDVGLIYYRKDLVPSPPNSWEALTSMATSAQRQTENGYIWQGAEYEGLVCNFVEVLYGYGGTVLDPSDPKKVVVNSPQAQEALARMAGWVGTISPSAVTSFKEEDAHLIWQNGKATFMRNWPFAYNQGNDPSRSKIVGKFDVHSMLYGGKNLTGHSCIGGWQLGINAFSKNKDAAWEFIKYMIGADTQKRLALDASQIGTLTSTYNDPDVLKKIAFFKNLAPVLQSAEPRPVSPTYLTMSTTIQSYVHQTLEHKLSVKDSLSLMQNDLQRIVLQ